MAKDNMEDYKKKYEDIVDRIKTMANDQDQPFVVRKAIEEQFPKIVVSDDEKVRKTLIGIFTYYNEKSHFFNSEVTKSKVLTWLEKQGEKKSEWTPMDEQHVENLLALIEGHGYPGEVAWLNSLEDRVQPKQGEQKTLWSEDDEMIKESIITGLEMLKDGASDKSLIALYSKKIDWLESLKDRVGCEVNCTTTKEWSEEDEVGLDAAMWAIKQAKTIAKDENDMGNLWHAERWLKDLKERIDCEADCTTTKDWSGEDEEMLTAFLHKVEVCDLLTNRESVWVTKRLKSLKDRILPQLKQEWSEDDEYYRNIIMYCLNGECVGNADKENAVLWLKSLKERVGNFDDGYKVGFSAATHNQWKPSDAQIASLTIACDRNDRIGFDLTQLLKDLKKLKE